MAPHRVAHMGSTSSVLGLISGAPAVLVAWLQIATGVHWVLFAFVLALMFLDWSAGALRADLRKGETYRPGRDLQGLRTRAAYVLMICAAFVLDGMLLAFSEATGLWPGVFRTAPLTILALIAAARPAVSDLVKNLGAIVGRKNVYPLAIAVDAMDQASARIARGVTAALSSAEEGREGDISLPGDGA